MSTTSDLDGAFHVLLTDMISGGIGRSRGKWSNVKLADALAGEGEETDVSAISLWRRGKVLPSEKKFRALEKLFSKPGPDGVVEPARRECLTKFRFRWETENNDREKPPRKSSGTLVWKQVAGGHELSGLLNFLIDEIVAWNDESGIYDVNATLRFGRYVDKDDNRTVTLEAAAAWLEVPSTGHQIARGMLVGDENRLPHDHFAVDASGSEITGPKANGFLNGGVLFGVERIAAVQATGSEEGPLTFLIVAPQTDLSVTVTLTADGDPAVVPETKVAVLKRLLIGPYGVDSQGRAILARRQYRRARAE